MPIEEGAGGMKKGKIEDDLRFAIDMYKTGFLDGVCKVKGITTKKKRMAQWKKIKDFCKDSFDTSFRINKVLKEKNMGEFK